MGNKTRRGIIAASAAVATAAALSFGGSAAFAASPVTPNNPGALDASIDGNTGNQASFFRFASKDRVLTALFAAQNTTGFSADTAILASSGNYADALASSALADKLDAPILLANADGSLNPQVKAYLATFDNVIIVSGTGVIPESTKSALLLSGVDNVVRVSGVNRFETAAAIAVYTYVSSGSTGSINFILADGMNFPDALAAGPAAASTNNGLVLLTAGSAGVSPYTYELVSGHPVSWSAPGMLPSTTLGGIAINWVLGLGGHANVTVVGGAAQAAAANGDGITPGTEVEYADAIVGVDRYDTAAQVAAEYFTSAPSTYTIASGMDFPDAVVAGGWAANAEGPLLLTENDKLTGYTMDYLVDAADNGDTFVVFGGTGSVSKDVSMALAEEFQY